MSGQTSVSEYERKNGVTVRNKPLIPSYVSDPHPFRNDRPDLVIPFAVATYKFQISVYLPHSLEEKLAAEAKKEGIGRIDFSLKTLQDYLDEGKEFPHQEPLIDDENTGYYKMNIPEQTAHSLDSLATERDQPRWQTMYEIMTNALK